MKLKCVFDTVNMGEEIIAVPVGDSANQIHGVVKLNEAGKEIMELLKEDISEENIVAILASKYDNGLDYLKERVHQVIKVFRDAGILEE